MVSALKAARRPAACALLYAPAARQLRGFSRPGWCAAAAESRRRLPPPAAAPPPPPSRALLPPPPPPPLPMMDSRILEHPHAQFGGMVGFPYPLGHHHVYELAGHQLQAAAAAAASVPFSIDGLLNGSCAASVVNPTPLLPSACGDSQPFKLAGKSAPLALRLAAPIRRPGLSAAARRACPALLGWTGEAGSAPQIRMLLPTGPQTEGGAGRHLPAALPSWFSAGGGSLSPVLQSFSWGGEKPRFSVVAVTVFRAMKRGGGGDQERRPGRGQKPASEFELFPRLGGLKPLLVLRGNCSCIVIFIFLLL